jgi:peptidoglycan/LPS O-acetylase OafA/YrhL
MNDPGRLTTLDALRGVASLAVAWFHLSHEMGVVPQGSLLYRSGTYGWVGVEVFFVISGFVIPFALDREGYRISQYGRFLAKRVTRLDPPYLTAITLSLVIAAYYAWASHSRFPFTVPQILLHLGYLNAFVGFPWVNPVFWTLAIEFQYYLLIGLVFPLVSDRRAFWLLLVPSCLFLAFAVKNEALIFRYLPFFLFGLVAFQLRRRDLSRVVFVCCAALSHTWLGEQPGWHRHSLV